MSENTDIKVTMEDLGMAYRKTKVDLFYSQRPCRELLVRFEENLYDNLTTLYSKIKEKKVDHKGWTLRLKKIDTGKQPENGEVFASERFERDVNHTKSKVEFRLMENLPIEFHVFSSLWINYVGHKLDNKLAPAARGNRLRRNKSGDLNLLALGSMCPYIHAYRKWRDDSHFAMYMALKKDKSIITITTDINSFYHKLDVNFLKNIDFWNKIGVILTESEKNLNEMFVDSLKSWARATAVDIGLPEEPSEEPSEDPTEALYVGLPVGLPASAVIANIALFDFDEKIEKELNPIYYGRYVDDIILVIENKSGFKDRESVMKWILKRLNTGNENWFSFGPEGEGETKKPSFLKYSPSFLEKSEILFSEGKSKIFFLEGMKGISFLDSIRREAKARSSAWQELPEIPTGDEQIDSGMFSAVQSDGDAAASLRDTDKISLRRGGFALNLRNFEAYARALGPKEWKEQRHAFLKSFIRNFLILPDFADFYKYFGRVLSLATSCSDFELVKSILDALKKIKDELNKVTDITLISDKRDWKKSDLMYKFVQELKQAIREAIITAFPAGLTVQAKKDWNNYFGRNHDLFEQISIVDLRDNCRKLIGHDLYHTPLKHKFLYANLTSGQKKYVYRLNFNNFMEEKYEELVLSDVKISHDLILEIVLGKKSNTYSKVPGVFFPVRPLQIFELYLIISNPFDAAYLDSISKIVLGQRGFGLGTSMPYHDEKEGMVVSLGTPELQNSKVKIALTNWKTDTKNLKELLSGNNSEDLNRFRRLNSLINNIISSSELPQYIVFPELAIPISWFLPIALKLKDKNISIICGVEYLRSKGNGLRNQVWASLCHSFGHMCSIAIYRQDKQRAALHEERWLCQDFGKVLRPGTRWSRPPIIEHKGFRFSILNCSEITNIVYRASLRGQIDALFIPQWNKDTDGFSSLAEATALDLHAFIVYCNVRQYGDSRIRAPFKENWMRDVIRLKGGTEDCFVMGELDIEELRQFQSSNKSPQSPFKPVPDGYQISFSRKMTPK